MFLNSSHFEKKAEEKLRLKQLEIASEWDNIEHRLQDDRLWFFLTGNTKETNRIEFIFDLMKENDDKDTYATFRYFSERIREDNIEEFWGKVKSYYQSFLDWYDDRELFHIIGYLLAINATTIKEVYAQSVCMTKSNFKIYLKQIIKDCFKNVKFSELQYGEKNVEKLLLLYNILTMLKTQKDNSYFPFDLYKTGNWDIEHITSVKEAIPEKNQKAWLDDAKVFINTSVSEGRKLKERAENCDVSNEEEFKALFEDIVSHFNKDVTTLQLL